MLRLWRALPLFVVLVCHAGDHREESRASFRKGVELVQQGDLAAARDAFVRAYELFPHPSILLNLGLVRERLGDHLRAEQDLVKFLSDDGGASPAEIQSARGGLAEARTHIGTIDVRVAPPSVRARLDGRPLPLANGVIEGERAVEGEHVIELVADGYHPETVRVRVSQGRPARVETALAPIPALAASERQSPARAIAAASLFGASGVALVVGVACGVSAIARANAYNDARSDDYQRESVKSSGIALRTGADIAIISGIALAIGGIAVLFWPSPRAQISAGLGSVHLSASF